MSPNIRVVISDDESLFRTCLRRVLELPGHVIRDVYGVNVGTGFEVVGEAGTGQHTVELVQSLRPDLLLLDPVMPRMSGMDALREIDAGGYNVRTVLFAERIDRTQLLAAIQLGVRGFVLKDSTTSRVFEAIACVSSNHYWFERSLMTDLMEWVSSQALPAHEAVGKPARGLTRRQREVVAMVAAGSPNKDIARKFEVTEETIKHNLTRIFEIVGASNRLELAMVATRRGLLALEPGA